MKVEALLAFSLCFAHFGVGSQNVLNGDPATVLDADGNQYRVIRIGKQLWMAENLRVTRAADGGAVIRHDPNNDPAQTAVYGGLYDWKDALKVGPSGWRLPSDAEWTALESGLAATPAGGVKDHAYWKSKEDHGPEPASFQIRPAGYWNDQGFDNYFGSRAVFWTATPKDAHFVWSRVVGENSNELRRAEQHPQYGFSVRCVASTEA